MSLIVNKIHLPKADVFDITTTKLFLLLATHQRDGIKSSTLLNARYRLLNKWVEPVSEYHGFQHDSCPMKYTTQVIRRL